MNRLLTTFCLAAFLLQNAAADFSNAQLALHPRLPGDDPFIIEITGTWPNDCHPGEQKPVVESFNGHSVEIGFEIIIVHVTCNEIDTPYRVLVDMSESIRETTATGETLDIRVIYQGGTLEHTLDLVCPAGGECPVLSTDEEKPRPGLYYSDSVDNQGLLLSRQDNSMGIFPLIYDDSGRAGWFFGGNQVAGDSFFAEMFTFSNGDCFGCDPTGAIPELVSMGYISALFDQPGVIQVKINDGMFNQFKTTIYGYGSFDVGPEGEQAFLDIEGRWGLVENRGTNPPLGDITDFFPAAFEIVFESFTPADDTVPSPGQLQYLVTTLTGETLGQLVCNGQTSSDGGNSCDFIDPTDAAEPLFKFNQLEARVLSLEYGRAYITIGVAPSGKAVRLE